MCFCSLIFYENESFFSDTCIELWKIAKVELEKQTAEANEGFIKREVFSKSGIAKKEERTVRFFSLSLTKK